jgi:hypothetical protein
VVVLDRFENGATFGILDPRDGDISLAVDDPDWELEEGQRVPMSLEIDGRKYTGVAVAGGATTVAMAHVPGRVIEAMVQGQRATLTVGHDRFSMDLTNAAESIFDAAGYAKIISK